MFDIFFDKNRNAICKSDDNFIPCNNESCNESFDMTPKSTTYADPRIFSSSSPERYPNEIGKISNDVLGPVISDKDDLVSFRVLVKNYMDLTDEIKNITEKLEQLQNKKTILEQKILNDPQFEELEDFFELNKIHKN